MGLFDFLSKKKKSNFKTKVDFALYLEQFVPREIAQIYSEMAEQAGSHIDLEFVKVLGNQRYQFECPAHQNPESFYTNLEQIRKVVEELKLAKTNEDKMRLRRNIAQLEGVLVTVKINALSEYEFVTAVSHFERALVIHRELIEA